MNDRERSCSYCGQPLEPDDAFCGECGRPVPSKPAEATPSKRFLRPPHAGRPESETASKVVAREEEAGESSPHATATDMPPVPATTAASEQSRRKFGPLRLTGAVLAGMAILAAIFFVINKTSVIETNRQGSEPATDWSDTKPAADLDNTTVSRISIANTESFHTQNVSAGKIFVVAGTVVNGNPYPVKFVRLEAILYGPDDSFLTRQLSYAGNTIDGKLLISLPIQSIKLLLHTPYGHNDDEAIAGGGRLPFMFVFTGLAETDELRYDLEIVNADAE